MLRNLATNTTRNLAMALVFWVIAEPYPDAFAQVIERLQGTLVESSRLEPIALDVDLRGQGFAVDQPTLSSEVSCDLVPLESDTPAGFTGPYQVLVSTADAAVTSLNCDGSQMPIMDGDTVDIYPDSNCALEIAGVNENGPVTFNCAVQAKDVPEYSCCERNIVLNAAKAPKIVAKKTKLIPRVNGFKPKFRLLTLIVDFPIIFDCANQRDRKCIGKFDVEVVTNPNMGGVAPLAADVDVIRWGARNCDGRVKNLFNVRVQYTALYRGIGVVKGPLALKLSVPKAKGTINHLWKAAVKASGTKKIDAESGGKPEDKGKSPSRFFSGSEIQSYAP